MISIEILILCLILYMMRLDNQLIYEKKTEG